MAGLWDIVTQDPLVHRNIMKNPSFEKVTTPWATISSTLSLSASRGCFGTRCLKVQPLGAIAKEGTQCVTDEALTSGFVTIVSFYIRPIIIHEYRAQITDGASSNSGEIVVVQSTDPSSEWRRVWFAFTPTSSAVHTLKIFQNVPGLSTDEFYIDGVDVRTLTHNNEAYLSTYVDGDQPDCIWEGAEHASVSRRLLETRAGGKIRNLDFFNWYVLEPSGHGMPPVEVITQDLGQLEGEVYNRTRARARTLQLVSYLQGTTLPNLHVVRDEIINVVKPDAVDEPQPFLMRYRGNGAATSRILEVVYEGGLEMGRRDGFTETAPIRLRASKPYFRDELYDNKTLDVQDTESPNRIFARLKEGDFSILNGGISGGVTPIGRDAVWDKINGLMHVVFDGTTAGGVTCNNCGSYNYKTNVWTSLGSGANNGVTGIIGGMRAVAYDPSNNRVYVGGDFTAAGTVATRGIAYFDLTAGTWNAMGTGCLNNGVQDMAFDDAGNLWVVGSFTQMGGVANTSRLAVWTGSAWQARGTGLSGNGTKVEKGPDGLMWIGGVFDTANGVTVYGLTYWNGTTFVAIGTGPGLGVTGGVVSAMTWGLDGTMYLGGQGPASGFLQDKHLWKYNGSVISVLADTGLTGWIYSLYVDEKDGMLWIAAAGVTVAGLTMPSRVWRFNGTAFMPADFIDGGYNWYSIVKGPDTSIYFMGDVTSTVKTTGTVGCLTLQNTATKYPICVIKGPSSGTAKLVQLVNYTTSDAIFFDQALTLTANEVLYLDFKPGGRKFYSTTKGNLINRILRGSNLGTFKLKPGNNIIGMFSDTSTVSADLVWQERYWSADGEAVG